MLGWKSTLTLLVHVFNCDCVSASVSTPFCLLNERMPKSMTFHTNFFTAIHVACKDIRTKPPGKAPDFEAKLSDTTSCDAHWH